MFKFDRPFKPDAQALLDNIRRKGTSRRVRNMELFLDREMQEAICRRFDLDKGLGRDDKFFTEKRQILLARFLGYDHVYVGISQNLQFNIIQTEDTAGLKRDGGRGYQNESRGPIATWEEFEKYPWPDPKQVADKSLTWYEKNLPDDLCVICNVSAHFAEHLSWFMGYEQLCYAVFDQTDLVMAIYDKILEMARNVATRVLQFSCVKAIWGSDDMGFKTSTFLSPPDMRKYILPGHKIIAEMAHQGGRPYLLHACGCLGEIIPDLVDDVKIDAKHSFEDTIESVIDAKQTYGQKVALLGGIDVDFLCRADEAAIRQRVRRTLDACMSGGGYCLGSGNSIANYVPMDHYLAMLDEGRKYA